MEKASTPILTKRRVRRLIPLLGFLILAFVLRDLAAWLPREPRLYLVNESGRTLDDEVIRSACGDIKLPRLEDGQSIRLDLHPRADCTYTIDGHAVDGYYLLNLLQLGRNEKADVKLELGIDYLEADVSKKFRIW